MNKCELLMQKHDHFIEKAREQRDTNLRRFYYNVAQGYEMRARALSLEEAAAPVQADGARS